MSGGAGFGAAVGRRAVLETEWGCAAARGAGLQAGKVALVLVVRLAHDALLRLAHEVHHFARRLPLGRLESGGGQPLEGDVRADLTPPATRRELGEHLGAVQALHLERRAGGVGVTIVELGVWCPDAAPECVSSNSRRALSVSRGIRAAQIGGYVPTRSRRR